MMEGGDGARGETTSVFKQIDALRASGPGEDEVIRGGGARLRAS